jgi:hypothetical protein
VQSAIAMRYSVNVSAATIFMTEFYKQLLLRKNIDQAVSLGRQALYENKDRETPLGMPVKLEDWVIPILYKNMEVNFNLIEPKNQQETININQITLNPNHPIMLFGGEILTFS